MHTDFWTEFDDKFNPGPALVDDSGNVTLDESGRPNKIHLVAA